MDYAFVPAVGNLQGVADAFSSHPNTSVLTAGCDTIGDFLRAVETASTGPFNLAEDLILATHADDEGVILIDLAPGIPGPVTYENLQGLTAIQLPADLNKPGTKFRMFGCLIGSKRCENLLKALKQALGNPSGLVAPKYVYQVRKIQSKGIGATVQGVQDSKGYLENMAYQLRLSSKDGLGSRAEVVQAFQKANDSNPPQFVDIAGNKIPSDQWENWIPKGTLDLKPAIGYGILFDFYVSVPIAVLNSMTLLVKVKLQALWVAKCDIITIPPIDVPGDSGDPNKNTTIVEKLKAGLPNVPTFQESHEFPIYKRHYFESLDNFIDGIHWTFAIYQGVGQKWSFKGQRYLYELEIPITEPGSDNLISNYYPEGQTPVEKMFHGHTVDPRLFTTV